ALTQVSRINKVLFEDLQMAKLIQTNILSEEYKIRKNLEFEVLYEPMMEVGGDIYDIFELSHNYYRIFVADATGHGIQAALTTMIIKGEYDKIKKTEGLPYIILAIFNNIFTKKYLNLNVFFTCIVMDIDLNRNKILYSTAGQPDQYLLHQGKLEVIPGGGKMIGILENMKFLERETAFVPGDKLLLFSDGLFEQFSQGKEELGEGRFSQLVENRIQEKIGTLVPHLLEDVKDWIGGGEVNDDICVVGIEYPPKKKKSIYAS
ncbi:MAG: guanylate cyclase, partial [Spirochaetae bacterium HGW-Spirochaetae-6]